MTVETLQIFVFAGVGLLIAVIQERFGSFQNAKPGTKQMVNWALSLITPAVIAYTQGWWKPEFGSVEDVLAQVVYLLVPVGVWAFGQITHQFDRLVTYGANWLKNNK